MGRSTGHGTQQQQQQQQQQHWLSAAKHESSVGKRGDGTPARRRIGMRVLLFTMIAAVAGVLYLEHVRLQTWQHPTSVVQPLQQHRAAGAAASASSQQHAASASQQPHDTLTTQPQQQQQQQQQQQPELEQPAPSADTHEQLLLPLPQNRLLLATHSRLMWYFPDSHEFQVLHEGEGVHYGMFPGVGSKPSTVWTAVRPHNWRPTSTKEWLVELDMETGREVSRVAIPSRFTHDVVRANSSVYVCDTGNGRVLELSFPDMTPVRSMDLFSLKDHPNTLTPLDADNFLVVLHNLGMSDIVRVNVSAVEPIADPKLWLAGQALHAAQPEEQDVAVHMAAPPVEEGPGHAVVGRVKRVGDKAHGLVPWQGAYIMLDSDNGALIALDLTGAAAGEGFRVVRLWKAPEDGMFLKGLAIVDDIAYFGISPWAPRSARDDPTSNNQLAAFDLLNSRLLWRREIPTGGLLNTVGAPHLSAASTYLPSYSHTEQHEPVLTHHDSPEVAAAIRSFEEIGYPPKVGGYWSSGLPYLDASYKATTRPWEAGLQLPLVKLNISGLQAAVASLPAEAWTYEYQAKHSAVMAGREGNQKAFKPGVEGIVLLFSANDGSGPVYKFPAYDFFAPVLEPLLEEILGKRDMQHIIRLQLALMKPGVSDIKIHVDSGGYAIRGHRLHIPVFTHPQVAFDVCPHRYEPDPTHVPAAGEPQRMLDIQECFKIPTVEGIAFELNNRAAHKVSNLSPIARVHVVVDLCEEPHPRVNVPPGTICDYDMEKGLLCTYPEGAAPVVMPPAQWLDAAAAAAEAPVSALPTSSIQRESEEAAAGYGTDGSAGASAAAASHAPIPLEDDAAATAPAPTLDGAVSGGSFSAQHDPATASAGAGVLGDVRNGQTSTWVTAAMHSVHGVALA